MQWLRNLGIFRKLLGGFALVVILTAMLGGMAIVKLGELDGQVHDLSDNWVPSMNALQSMRAEFLEFRTRELAMLNAKDEAALTEFIKGARQNREAFDKFSAEFAKLLSTAEERKLYDATLPHIKAYWAEHENALTAIAQKDKAGTDKSINGESRKYRRLYIAAMDDLAKYERAALAASIEATRTQYGKARSWIFGVTGAAIVISLLLGWLIAGSITRPLQLAVESADAVSRGELRGRIETNSTDEPGKVLASLKRMQENLLARQTSEQKIAAETLRVKNALNKCTTNVMIANADCEVVYMNESVSGMMARNESELRKVLPQFDAKKLIGANIDIFHKNPSHQRNMLANLKSTYRTEIKVGSLTFSLIANPIVDEKGERVGSVVEWKDRTDEVAVEGEVGGIVKAAMAGDFTGRIDVNGKEGFFKALGENINQLMQTSHVGLNEVVRVLGALAKGDLTEKITNEYKGTFGQLKDDSNKTVEQLSSIVGQIREATESIHTASKEIATGNSDLSSRTEEQASSLEETASSMEELTSTVKQNAENAKQANQLAIGASAVAVKGGQVVSEVVDTMGSINESSKKIVDIISVIDGIAFQTNILALNAAVEAARAGEQGRGFAVVATEVRNLAQRSAAAAKEIKSLISDSVEKVGSGTKLVDQAGKTMEEIVTSIKRVTDIMSEITAASQEQSAGIEQVNTAITQMDEVTQQNAALVEEAAAAAESLQEQAQNLAQTVAVFRVDSAAHMITAQSTAQRRASNVELFPAKVAKAAESSKQASASSGKIKPMGKTGTDDEWSEF